MKIKFHKKADECVRLFDSEPADISNSCDFMSVYALSDEYTYIINDTNNKAIEIEGEHRILINSDGSMWVSNTNGSEMRVVYRLKSKVTLHEAMKDYYYSKLISGASQVMLVIYFLCFMILAR